MLARTMKKTSEEKMPRDGKMVITRLVAARLNGKWAAKGCDGYRIAATTGHKTLNEAIDRLIEILKTEA